MKSNIEERLFKACSSQDTEALRGIMSDVGINEKIETRLHTQYEVPEAQDEVEEEIRCLINKHTVSDDDIQFMSSQLEESPLDEITTNSITAVSPHPYTLVDTRLAAQSFYKVIGGVDSPVENLLHTVLSLDTRQHFESNSTSAVLLDFFESNKNVGEYATTITQESFPMLWPLQSRDVVLATSVIRGELSGKKTCFVIRKTTTHVSAPFVDETYNQEAMIERYGTAAAGVLPVVRGLLYDGWVIQERTANTSIFVNVNVYNMALAFEGCMVRFFEGLSLKRASNLHTVLCSLSKIQNKSAPSGHLWFTLHSNDSLSDRSANSIPLNKSEQSNLKRLIYTSKAIEGLQPKDIKDISETSRRNNMIQNITGVLVCSEGLFYQVLEGEQKCIDDLFQNIINDRRHRNVLCIHEDFGLRESDRQYPNWSMKVVELKQFNHHFAETLEQVCSFATDIMPDTCIM
ncbi:pacB [Acrasis kona]|uniref:PacB n=1 Tax=Acrasis kona TaxID=1008807 RepID=A0AAW2YJ32_9EUKA